MKKSYPHTDGSNRLWICYLNNEGFFDCYRSTPKKGLIRVVTNTNNSKRLNEFLNTRKKGKKSKNNVEQLKIF